MKVLQTSQIEVGNLVKEGDRRGGHAEVRNAANFEWLPRLCRAAFQVRLVALSSSAVLHSIVHISPANSVCEAFAGFRNSGGSRQDPKER